MVEDVSLDEDSVCSESVQELESCTGENAVEGGASESEDFNKLHSDEVQQMLDASDEAIGQYDILRHKWQKGELLLIVQDRWTDVEVTVPVAASYGVAIVRLMV